MEGSTFTLLAYLGITFAGMSGALIAIENELDIVGVVMLACITSLGGGIVRDILLGALPPASITSYDYLSLAVASAAVTIFYYRAVKKLEVLIVFVDAISLGVFLVYGLEKAISYHMNMLATIAMGILTATFGGLIRDILITRLPFVFRTEIYVINAIIGAVLFVFIQGFWPNWIVDPLVIVLVIVLRLTTYFKKWHVTTAKEYQF